MIMNRLERDESQQVVGKTYSQNYNTLPKQSRLQLIQNNNNSKLCFIECS